MSGKYWILRCDVRDICEQLPANYFDACSTDPPYGYGFMAKKWDYDVPSKETWESVLRVLKPGAHLLSCGGSRTYHRVACNIEDAGFELRDCLHWVYAKGFPKSLNVSKAIDKVSDTAFELGRAAVVWSGFGTSLKPAHEPIVLARKPLDGTVVNNALKWGTGALAIDACRVGSEIHRINRWSDGSKPFGGGAGHPYSGVDVSGRWPANLLLDDGAAEVLDLAVGERKSGKVVRRNGGGGKIFRNADGEGVREDGGYSDGGGPSRFYQRASFPQEELDELTFHFSAKVSTKEREAGCELLPRRSAGEMTDREEGTDGLNSPRASAGRGGGSTNPHPTLKPLSLCRYMARMIKPPVRVGGPPSRILVPFCGAGSEMIGALLEGWDEVVGIELDEEDQYIRVACARIDHWTKAAKREAA